MHVEPIRLRHHPLPVLVAIRDVVRTQKSREHCRQIHWHERESGGIPAHEDHPLEVEELVLASGEDRACVTGVADGCFNERAVVPATPELVLNNEAPA